MKCLMRCDTEYLFSYYVNHLEDVANLIKASQPFVELSLRIESEDPYKQGCEEVVSAFAWGGAFWYSASPDVSQVCWRRSLIDGSFFKSASLPTLLPAKLLSARSLMRMQAFARISFDQNWNWFYLRGFGKILDVFEYFHSMSYETRDINCPSILFSVTRQALIFISEAMAISLFSIL